MVSIYDYLDPNAYLRDFWEDRREADPAFSVRAWAKQMGMKVHGPLHQMLHGKRKVPKKYVPLFIETLRLSNSEGVYFDALVDYKKTQNSDEKNYYLNRLRELSPVKELNLREYRLNEHLRDPLNYIITEMVTLKQFRNDPHWISAQLHPHVEPLQVREIIERLIDLEILIPSPDGKFLSRKEIPEEENASNTKTQNSYHLKACNMAKHALNDLEPEQREFHNCMVNITEKDLFQAKEAIRLFKNEFIRRFEAAPFQGTQTFCLGLHLFETTREPLHHGAPL